MADFTSYEYRVALTLGDREDGARATLSLSDPVVYPPVATQATVAAAELDSGRVTRGLRAVARQLRPYRGDAGVDTVLALL